MQSELLYHPDSLITAGSTWLCLVCDGKRCKHALLDEAFKRQTQRSQGYSEDPNILWSFD